MGHPHSKSIRVQDDPEILDEVHAKNYEERRQIYIPAETTTTKKEPSGKNRQSLRAKVLHRVFPEDLDRVQTSILDPQGTIVRQWSKIFLVACLISLFVDPLFFFLPVVSDQVCIETGISLKVILTILRSVADVFYIIQIFIRLRTAYVAPPSRVFGRGELVIDSRKIASRYVRRGFCIDFIAALPLAQILIWVIIPNLKGSAINVSQSVLRFILIFQFLPKLFLVFPLTTQVGKAVGFVVETAWLGAAYNLLLFLLASHVMGACWYILSIEREEACWRSACDHDSPPCQYNYFDCNWLGDSGRKSWYQSSNITNLCTPRTSSYAFGIYGDAVNNGVTSAPFFNKYFYCFWWGLRNLSTLGQNLSTSTYIGEIIFSILVGCVGLVLFASLIGNMQRYLLSTTIRLEEWRIKRTDTEKWMHHRHLPEVLRVSVRKYDQYKWLATRGVDEEALLSSLPFELQRDIKRHLCLDLVRRVPLFGQMDERMLDAVCERLKPALCTEGTFLVREGDLVNVVLFIVRGYLNSYTTNSGDSNSSLIGPGNFCGEELLTWALETDPSIILPSSTRTVKAIAEVEGFALRAEDLKFVVSQFRKKHSKQLRHNFRFHSQQWRTWAAFFIQAAWRRYKRRKESADNEARAMKELTGKGTEAEAGSAMFKAIIKASSRFGVSLSFKESGGASVLQRPAEPDFFLDDNAN